MKQISGERLQDHRSSGFFFFFLLKYIGNLDKMISVFHLSIAVFSKNVLHITFSVQSATLFIILGDDSCGIVTVTEHCNSNFQ